MKRTFKKLIAVLIAAIMVAGIVPMLALAKAFEKDDGADQAVASPYGYIPFERKGGTAISDAYKRGDMETYNRLTGRTRDALPPKYDSRDYNYITAVRNQGNYGTCWTFGTMAPIEAYMIKHGIINGATGAAAATSMDLSEYHLAWFAYTNAYDAEGMLTGDKTTCIPSVAGGSSYLDMGGNFAVATFTVMRWEGAASETTSALQYSNASTSGLDSQYAYDYNVAHVTDATWISVSDADAVKQAIMEYGAGTISYFHDSSYLNSSTGGYYYNAGTNSNHAVTVVGWDDNYAVSNFRSGKRPSNPGAWIIKNSWGTTTGDGGYIYISYEDTSALNSTCCFYTVAAVDNYQHCYQYDGTANVINYQSMGDNCQIANIYTANGSQMLRAVALAPWDEATSYTLYIYKNLTTDTDPTSGTLVATQSGYFPYSGYFTIPLDQSVSLANGEKFSVVFTLSVPEPDPDENNTYVHIPYDATDTSASVVTWLKFTHTNHGNTSYYREANGSWTDVPDNGDFRIKAYTDDLNYTVSAVSNNTNYGTVSVDGTTITATPAAGYYVSGYEVVSGTATATINGNIINVAPESDCTIRVIFSPKPSYTVNFTACGASQGSQTALIYDAITLPTTVSVNPDGWTFIGWAEQQTNGETEIEPTYYAPGASYTVNGNATLYALYTRVDDEGGSETVYQLVTATPSDWAGNYVITNNPTSITNLNSSYVLKGVSGSSSGTTIESASNCTVFTSSGITLEDSMLKNVANDYVFTIAASGNYYSIKSVSTGAYYGMNSSSILTAYTSLNTSYCRWTPAINSSGVVQFKNNANGSYPYFGWSTNYSYFWSASSSNANVLRLWKETEINNSVTYYNTDPIDSTATYYTVIFKDWDGTVLSTQQVEEGTAATAPANPTREGYTFTGWDKSFANITEDTVVTAQYSINSYTLTIYYKYADGTTAAAAYTQTYNYGAAYSVTSPEIARYAPDQAVVSGTMGAANAEVTVTYTKIVVLGDLDDDGEVTLSDVSLFYSYITNKGTLSDEALANADVNQDGVINTADASCMYRIILGM
ncbi:MAG: InlB B-repeat-containing protein [Clostridiales bacterium]|nr:InlB B-repeat-containing protein [Clostridiales bacterium]